MPIEQVEMNTIVTFLGMLCATVQGVIGFYAGYVLKKLGVLKANDILCCSFSWAGSWPPWS